MTAALKCLSVLLLLTTIRMTLTQGLAAVTFSDANWTGMGQPGADGPVNAMEVDGEGKLYIGGYFTVVGDVFATNIAKWGGSRWSALGLGVDSIVRALAVSGSNLYAGGRFKTAGGSQANFIAKWNGSNWSALGSGMDCEVFALAVSGSDLYAAGEFTTAGGIPANAVAKWDGSNWSALGSGLRTDPGVRALAVSGNDLYAGGHFTNAGGTAANFIAKWDGSTWSALGSGMGGTGPWSPVYALAVSGSDVYAGGLFSVAGGNPANQIAKWNGSGWSALGSGVDFWLNALAVSGGDLYAGGNFRTAGGSQANCIAKWNGSSWSALGSGMNTEVFALAVSGSDLYAGGLLTTAGGKTSTYIAHAYLERPTLSILRSNVNILLSWPTFYETYAMQQNSDATNANTWSNASFSLTTNGANKSATVPISSTNLFFRLIGN